MHINSVLLVDDDCDVRRIGEKCLDARFDVYVARSGEDCLTVAEGDQPDLILLDVKMPVMNGFSTLIRLRSNPITAAIPVILMTSCVRTHGTVHYRNLDVIGFLEKPFDPIQLPEQIRKLAAAR